jgi:hypothetical protein
MAARKLFMAEKAVLAVIVLFREVLPLVLAVFQTLAALACSPSSSVT